MSNKFSLKTIKASTTVKGLVLDCNHALFGITGFQGNSIHLMRMAHVLPVGFLQYAPHGRLATMALPEMLIPTFFYGSFKVFNCSEL